MKHIPLTIQAHAKINLDLRILENRTDGFHELRTVFQSLDLHDTITFVEREGPFELSCREPGVPLDSGNLVWRAAVALWKARGHEDEPRDLSVKLVKRIPVRAGLGGGSADAVATLTALSHIWSISLSQSKLYEVAAGLGADVPFFLWGGTALGLGRGDTIYKLVDLEEYWVVIILPRKGVSTSQAYVWHDEERQILSGSNPVLQGVSGPWSTGSVRLINDLEGPVVRHVQEIGDAKAALLAAGAVGSVMSGSGSAVFGLFEVHHAAKGALLSLTGLGWRSILTRTIPREEYERCSRLPAQGSGKGY